MIKFYKIPENNPKLGVYLKLLVENKEALDLLCKEIGAISYGRNCFGVATLFRFDKIPSDCFILESKGNGQESYTYSLKRLKNIDLADKFFKLRFIESPLIKCHNFFDPILIDGFFGINAVTVCTEDAAELEVERYEYENFFKKPTS